MCTRQQGWAQPFPRTGGVPYAAVKARAPGCSEPAFLPGRPRGLHAIRRTELGNRVREVVSHGAIGEAECRRDGAARHPVRRHAKHLALAVTQWVTLRPGFASELRVDGAPTAMNSADRVGQLLDRKSVV